MSFYSYFAYYYHYYYYFFIIIIIFSSLKISIPVEQLWSPCLFHILPIPLFLLQNKTFLRLDSQNLQTWSAMRHAEKKQSLF